MQASAPGAVCLSPSWLPAVRSATSRRRVTGDGGVLQALAAIISQPLSARVLTTSPRLASHGERCTYAPARKTRRPRACVRASSIQFDFALFLALLRHGRPCTCALRSTARGAGNARPLRVVCDCERCFLDRGLGRVEGADSGRKHLSKYVGSDGWMDRVRATAVICVCTMRLASERDHDHDHDQPTGGRASEPDVHWENSFGEAVRVRQRCF